MNTSYILSRLGQAVLVLFVTFTVAFFLLSALPSDATMARFGDPSLGLSEAEIEAIRHETGVDNPLFVQYALALWGFVTGNFGISTQTGSAVSELLVTALPSTLVLAITSVGLGIIVALLVSFIATLPGGGFISSFFRGLPSFMVSLPGFFVAIVLLQLFSFQLGWVRVIDPSPLEGLILPALTLSVPMAAPLIQVLIRSIDEVNQEPFVQVVRARGASESWIFWRNVLRNALLPALTMAGLLFGELISGAVVTETVFGRTGLGSLVVNAVSNRDTPTLLAVVIIAATAYVIINLIVDLLYPIIDVRLRGRLAPAVSTEAADHRVSEARVDESVQPAAEETAK